MKAVISVIGQDKVGILAKVSSTCAEVNANVIEVTQSVMDQYFAMIMLIDISEMKSDIDELKRKLEAKLEDMQIHVMHEDIFKSMHNI
jgi:ACT domain-containing protein